MKKYIVLFLTVFMLILPTMTSAHTYLSDSNPQEGEVVEEPLQEIELYFETKIESASTFDLANEQDEVIPVDISVGNDMMTGTLSEPLADGTYTVQWRIIGADGHPITEEFGFEVTGQENAANEEAAEGATENEPAGNDLEANEGDDPQQESEQEIETEESVNEVEQTEQEAAETEQSPDRFPWAIVMIVVLLLVVVLFSIRWLARRK